MQTIDVKNRNRIYHQEKYWEIGIYSRREIANIFPVSDKFSSLTKKTHFSFLYTDEFCILSSLSSVNVSFF